MKTNNNDRNSQINSANFIELTQTNFQLHQSASNSIATLSGVQPHDLPHITQPNSMNSSLHFQEPPKYPENSSIDISTNASQYRNDLNLYTVRNTISSESSNLLYSKNESTFKDRWAALLYLACLSLYIYILLVCISESAILNSEDHKYITQWYLQLFWMAFSLFVTFISSLIHLILIQR
ncbi:hypothetical protein BB561_001217 [Smittium simulii]|uniref:Transmembrane protein n=1 Tax=Smittium simulii TaxID=133385 RepID=A0A2T9YVM5_9FUNG|nr:hypothetical protein BB561_001217 [Smittium simulii]